VIARPLRNHRGAALLVAVMITAVLSVVVGAVGLFALADVRIAAASREQVQARAAVDAALEVAVAALATEVDLAAVRSGIATAAASGTPRLTTADGEIDVGTLTGSLARTRSRLPPPWGSDRWRPYLWGRLSELVAAGGAGPDEPLVVVWVRGDVGSGVDPERLELAIAAVTPGHARASAIALVGRRPGGLALDAVWPESEVLSGP
jgi:Tfp pilus assembly protein PilX